MATATALGPPPEESLQVEMSRAQPLRQEKRMVVQRALYSNAFRSRKRCRARGSAKMSTTERPVQGVPMPVAHTLGSNVLFTPGDSEDNTLKINVPALQNHFYHEGRLEVDDVLYILNTATEIFRSEPNVLHIASPVNSKIK